MKQVESLKDLAVWFMKAIRRSYSFKISDTENWWNDARRQKRLCFVQLIGKVRTVSGPVSAFFEKSSTSTFKGK